MFAYDMMTIFPQSYFQVDFTEMYPADPPVIICLSDIYHPNIDTSTIEENNVCLNLFDSDFWCEGFGIQGCVCGKESDILYIHFNIMWYFYHVSAKK